MLCGQQNAPRPEILGPNYQCTNLGTWLLNTAYPNYDDILHVPEKVMIQWHRGGYMVTSALMPKSKGTRIGCPDICDEEPITDVPIAPVHLVVDAEPTNPLSGFLRRFKKKKVEGPTIDEVQNQVDFLTNRINELETLEKKRKKEKERRRKEEESKRGEEEERIKICSRGKCGIRLKIGNRKDKKRERRKFDEKEEKKKSSCSKEYNKREDTKRSNGKKERGCMKDRNERKESEISNGNETESRVSEVSTETKKKVVFKEGTCFPCEPKGDASTHTSCACVPLRKIGPEEIPDMLSCAQDDFSRPTIKKKLTRNSIFCFKEFSEEAKEEDVCDEKKCKEEVFEEKRKAKEKRSKEHARKERPCSEKKIKRRKYDSNTQIEKEKEGGSIKSKSEGKRLKPCSLEKTNKNKRPPSKDSSSSRERSCSVQIYDEYSCSKERPRENSGRSKKHDSKNSSSNKKVQANENACSKEKSKRKPKREKRTESEKSWSNKRVQTYENACSKEKSKRKKRTESEKSSSNKRVQNFENGCSKEKSKREKSTDSEKSSSNKRVQTYENACSKEKSKRKPKREKSNYSEKSSPNKRDETSSKRSSRKEDYENACSRRSIERSNTSKSTDHIEKEMATQDPICDLKVCKTKTRSQESLKSKRSSRSKEHPCDLEKGFNKVKKYRKEEYDLESQREVKKHKREVCDLDKNKPCPETCRKVGIFRKEDGEKSCPETSTKVKKHLRDICDLDKRKPCPKTCTNIGKYRGDNDYDLIQNKLSYKKCRKKERKHRSKHRKEKSSSERRQHPCDLDKEKPCPEIYRKVGEHQGGHHLDEEKSYESCPREESRVSLCKSKRNERIRKRDRFLKLFNKREEKIKRSSSLRGGKLQKKLQEKSCVRSTCQGDEDGYCRGSGICSRNKKKNIKYEKKGGIKSRQSSCVRSICQGDAGEYCKGSGICSNNEEKKNEKFESKGRIKSRESSCVRSTCQGDAAEYCRGSGICSKYDESRKKNCRTRSKEDMNSCECRPSEIRKKENKIKREHSKYQQICPESFECRANYFLKENDVPFEKYLGVDKNIVLWKNKIFENSSNQSEIFSENDFIPIREDKCFQCELFSRTKFIKNAWFMKKLKNNRKNKKLPVELKMRKINLKSNKINNSKSKIQKLPGIIKDKKGNKNEEIKGLPNISLNQCLYNQNTHKSNTTESEKENKLNNDCQQQKIRITISGAELIEGSYNYNENENNGQTQYNIQIFYKENNNLLNKNNIVFNNESFNHEDNKKKNFENIKFPENDERHVFIEQNSETSYRFGLVDSNEDIYRLIIPLKEKNKNITSGVRINKGKIRLSAGGDDIIAVKKIVSDSNLFSKKNKSNFFSQFELEKSIGECKQDLIIVARIRSKLGISRPKCECGKKCKSPEKVINILNPNTEEEFNTQQKTEMEQPPPVQEIYIRREIAEYHTPSPSPERKIGCCSAFLKRCCKCRCCVRCCSNLDLACCCCCFYHDNSYEPEIVGLEASKMYQIPIISLPEEENEQIIGEKAEHFESIPQGDSVPSCSDSPSRKFWFKFRFFKLECYCGRKFTDFRTKRMNSCPNYVEEEYTPPIPKEPQTHITPSEPSSPPSQPASLQPEPLLSPPPPPPPPPSPSPKKTCCQKCCPCCFHRKRESKDIHYQHETELYSTPIMSRKESKKGECCKMSSDYKKSQKRKSKNTPAPLENFWLPCCRFFCRICCPCCPSGFEKDNEIRRKEFYATSASPKKGRRKKKLSSCKVWIRNFLKFHQERICHHFCPCHCYCIICRIIEPELVIHQMDRREYYKYHQIENKESSYFDARPTMMNENTIDAVFTPTLRVLTNENETNSWQFRGMSKRKSRINHQKRKSLGREYLERNPWVVRCDHIKQRPNLIYLRPGFWSRFKRNMVSIL